jgi:hypothetical protein
VCVGKHLKDGGTELEGDRFEFITSFDTLSSMGQDLKSCGGESSSGSQRYGFRNHLLVTYCSKFHRLSLSLITVNEITSMG